MFLSVVVEAVTDLPEPVKKMSSEERGILGYCFVFCEGSSLHFKPEILHHAHILFRGGKAERERKKTQARRQKTKHT